MRKIDYGRDNIMRTIYILWLRQLKRYFRSKARIVGSLGQPLLFLIALGFGFGPIYAKAGGGNYLQFLAPGIIAMSILFTSIFSGIEIIWDKQFGFLKETLVAPVSRMKIMFGRTLGGGHRSCNSGNNSASSLNRNRIQAEHSNDSVRIIVHDTYSASIHSTGNRNSIDAR